MKYLIIIVEVFIKNNIQYNNIFINTNYLINKKPTKLTTLVL